MIKSAEKQRPYPLGHGGRPKTKIEKGKDDPRTIWKIFKEYGASRKTATNEIINGLKENDQLISDDKEMANVFNKYFVNV